MKTGKLINYTLGLLLATSCSGPGKVSIDQEEGINFRSFKTYNFLSNNAGNDSLSKKLSWSLGMAKLAISGEMKKKGLTQNNVNPDLLINVGMVVSEKVQTRETNFSQDAPRYIGQRRYSWKSEDVYVGRYNQGTIAVDIIDRKNNKMIWNGVAEGTVPKKQKKVQQVIQKGIAKLFSKLPVSSTGSIP